MSGVSKDSTLNSRLSKDQRSILKVVITVILLGLLFKKSVLSSDKGFGPKIFKRLLRRYGNSHSPELPRPPIFAETNQSPEDANPLNIARMVAFGVISVIVSSILIL